ncbi:MAG: hypothetical protein Q4E47_02040 [Candidatus Saccharibacteria bacterium]|nr:hypothetical protein [Candidatus Saccharibacteria bacterium]
MLTTDAVPSILAKLNATFRDEHGKGVWYLPKVGKVQSGEMGKSMWLIPAQVDAKGTLVPITQRVENLSAVELITPGNEEYLLVTPTGQTICWLKDDNRQLIEGVDLDKDEFEEFSNLSPEGIEYLKSQVLPVFQQLAAAN